MIDLPERSNQGAVELSGAATEPFTLSTHSSLGQHVILITRDRLELYVRDFEKGAARKYEIATPGLVFLAILLALVTSTPHDAFGFSAATWQGVLVVLAALAVAWFILAILRTRNALTIDGFLARVERGDSGVESPLATHPQDVHPGHVANASVKRGASLPGAETDVVERPESRLGRRIEAAKRLHSASEENLARSVQQGDYSRSLAFWLAALESTITAPEDGVDPALIRRIRHTLNKTLHTPPAFEEGEVETLRTDFRRLKEQLADNITRWEDDMIEEESSVFILGSAQTIR